MADKVFTKGIRTFAKHNSAPDFVLGELVITPNELFTWLKVRAHSTLPSTKKRNN